MTEYEEFESRVSTALRAHAAANTRERPAEAVAQEIIAKTRQRPTLSLRWAVAGGAIALATVIAGSWAITSGLVGSGSNASDPAFATVNEVRYGVSVTVKLSDATTLQPYAEIAKTNVPDQFDDRTALRIGTIDPSALLVARAPSETEQGSYRLLWGPAASKAYPEVCAYLPDELRRISQECQT